MRFPKGDTHFKESDWDNYQILQYRELVRLSPQRKLALDCGAHAGIMTRRLSRDYDRVISFEPVHWALLASNTEDLNNVEIRPVAVGEKPGTNTISINIENSGDNVVGEGSLEINTITIDSLDISDVAAIKMDIQGSELSALLGARDTIYHDHPTLMLEIENHDPNRAPIESLMAEWDYRLAFSKNADRVYRWRGWDSY